MEHKADTYGTRFCEYLIPPLGAFSSVERGTEQETFGAIQNRGHARFLNVIFPVLSDNGYNGFH